MIEVMTVYRGKLFTSNLTAQWFTEEVEYIKPQENKPTKSEQASIDYIVRHYSIQESVLLWDSRKDEVQPARRHLCYLLRKKWRTYKRIWNILNKNHAAIIYLINKYDSHKNSEKISWTGN